MPCGNWQGNPSGWTISAQELISRIGTLGQLESVSRQLGQGPARYYQLPSAKGVIGFITAVSQPFCATCNRLRLTADGQLKPCLLSTDTIDLKTIISSQSTASRRDSQLADAFIRTAMLKPGVHHNEELTVMSRIGG
jgi:cyclic pyranopterin phosphate synthase